MADYVDEQVNQLIINTMSENRYQGLAVKKNSQLYLTPYVDYYTKEQEHKIMTLFRGYWDTWESVPSDASKYPMDFVAQRKPTTNNYMVVKDTSGYSTAGYEILESIESTGTQYLDLGITLKAGQRYEFKMLNKKDPSGVILGTEGAELKFVKDTDTDRITFLKEGTSTKAAANCVYNAKVPMSLKITEQSVGVLVNGSGNSNMPYKGTYPETKAFLFAKNVGDTAQDFSSFTLYELKATDLQGNVIAHYLPAKRTSDDAVGLADVITGTFYPNMGTGKFIAGDPAHGIIPNVPQPISGAWVFTYSGVWEEVGKAGWYPAYSLGQGGGSGGASDAVDVSLAVDGFYFITGRNLQSALRQVDSALFKGENRDSVLLSLEVLNDTIEGESIVPTKSLQSIFVDGRPSHADAGALVFDDFGTWGIIDRIDGTDAIVITISRSGTGAKDFLKLTGGTMTGNIKFEGSGSVERVTSASTKGMAVYGSPLGYGQGASLSLRDNTAESSQAGAFKAETGNNVTGHTHTLQGNPDGSITWDGKNIVRTINGKSADAEGNVSISTGSGGGRSIGEIFLAPFSESWTPDGAVLANGAQYTATQFPDFWNDWLVGAPKVMTCTMSQFDAEVSRTGSCTKFAVDKASHTFKVPLLSDGTFIEVGNGESYEAGIPDHDHTVSGTKGSSEANYAGRRFGIEATVTTSKASESNPIYGKSSTVQPKAVAMRAYVQLANGSIDQSAMDWARYMDGLNGKADKDLGNVSAQGKENVVGWMMPDYSAGVEVPVPINGATYIVPADGIYTFCFFAANSKQAYLIVNGVTTKICSSASNDKNANRQSTVVPLSKGDVIGFDAPTRGTVYGSTFYPYKK